MRFRDLRGGPGCGLGPERVRLHAFGDAADRGCNPRGYHPAQLYLDRTWSLVGEWIVSQAREGQEYDSGSFGAEIRTGGHFFKLLVTNQHQMNPTQTLAGAAEDFLDTGSWRFGFNIERRIGGLSRMK